MSHATTCPTETSIRSTFRFTLIALATVILLSGCAIWPKALTFWSSPEPPPEPQMQIEAPVPKSAAPDSAPETEPEAPKPAVVVPQAEPLPPLAPPAPLVPPAASIPTAPTTLAQGFYINVGLFAVPSNGSNAFKKIEDSGLPVFSDTVETKKGQLTRVRVGPFATRALADASARTIRTLKLDAIVFKQ
jgi:cell division septation protein DedD